MKLCNSWGMGSVKLCIVGAGDGNNKTVHSHGMGTVKLYAVGECEQ
jgi:hypothetical protein